jgi:hypothetical protein
VTLDDINGYVDKGSTGRLTGVELTMNDSDVEYGLEDHLSASGGAATHTLTWGCRGPKWAGYATFTPASGTAMARRHRYRVPVTDERSQDFRLDELRRLGPVEREMELELGRVRREIARLVVELLPPHASQAKIAEVVKASGFSRTLVEGVRGGQGMWSPL